MTLHLFESIRAGLIFFLLMYCKLIEFSMNTYALRWKACAISFITLLVVDLKVGRRRKQFFLCPARSVFYQEDAGTSKFRP